MSRSPYTPAHSAGARCRTSAVLGALPALLLWAAALPAADQYPTAADNSLLHSPTWQMYEPEGASPQPPAAPEPPVAPQQPPVTQTMHGMETMKFRPLTDAPPAAPEPPAPPQAATPPAEPEPEPAAATAAEPEQPAAAPAPAAKPRSAAVMYLRNRAEILRYQAQMRHPHYRRHQPSPRLIQHWMMHPGSHGPASMYPPYYAPPQGEQAAGE